MSFGNAGTTGTVDVDAADSSSTFPTPIPPKQPCILSKPGLAEGCDI